MASPFRVFRKYLKPLMVVFGVMIMFSFVILDPLANYMAGGRGGGGEGRAIDENAVAVSWDGGSLTNREISGLVQRRRILNDFLRHVETLGAQSAIEAGLEPAPLRVQRLLGEETPEQGVERSVVQTQLYADAAREAGMSVSDQVIVEYLLDLGRRRVTRDDIRRLVAGREAGATVDYIFDAIRDEMLANNYFRSNMYAFQTITPQERWRQWLRVNDRIIVEAAALPVENYLIEVKDPTDEQLTAFYEEFKDSEVEPQTVERTELPSPNPGFRTPRMVEVQYLQANVEDMVNKAEADVTEEEIAKYYEENKDQFIEADTGLLDDVLEASPPAEGSATEESTDDAETSPEGETAPPSDDSTTEQGSETSPPASTEAAPAESAPADDTSSSPPEEQAPSTETTDGAPAAEESEAAPAETDQSSRNASYQSVFRPVAFLQEAEGEADNTAENAEPAETESPAESAADAEAAANDEASAAEPPPAETPAPADAEAPATDSDAQPPAPETADAPAAPSADDAASDATAEPPITYQPLDEVRDLIRRHIARQKVGEAVATQMENLLGELSGEFNTHFSAVLEAQSKEEEPPAPQPELANLAPLAEKHGLTYEKLGPIAPLAFRDSPVGKSVNPENRMNLGYRLFVARDLEPYQPVLTADSESIYIVMMTGETPGRVPELKDIKDEVVHAWKMREAAKFALKDAEKLAKDANESGASLTDFFANKPDVKVVTTDPFSELTRGDVPSQFDYQRFRLSQPDGLVAPGLDFFNEAFDLNVGEVGAALNHPHTVAYVIRMVEHQSSPEELRTAFLAEANTWDGLPAMMERHVIEAQNALVTDLAGGQLDWKRNPDQITRNDE